MGHAHVESAEQHIARFRDDHMSGIGGEKIVNRAQDIGDLDRRRIGVRRNGRR